MGPKDLANLLALGEGFTIEFKRSGTSNLGREICAFANATGGLPAGMTEADLGVKSIPRNPLLFAMLHRMEAVEHIGSGIKRIRNLCRDYGVAEPKIEVSEHWFTVIFPRPELPEDSQGESGRDHVENRVDQVGTKSGPSRDQVGTKLRSCVIA